MATRGNENGARETGRRLALAALAALATAGALGACSARVAGGLDEARANEAVALLEERGIATTKELEGGGGEAHFAIDVPRGELGEALRALDAAALPRRIDPGIAETYAEASLVPSTTEERARYHAAVAGELARTIQRIDGVVDVRVHVAAPESNELGLDAPPAPARASVLVTTRGPGFGRAIDANAIRSIVVGAVDGLSPQTVAIVVLPASAGPRVRGRLVAVGPFRLAAGSARPLAFLLGASLLVHVATATVLMLLLRQRRGLGRRAAEQPADGAASSAGAAPPAVGFP